MTSTSLIQIDHRAPARFTEHVFERTFEVPIARDRVWAWLDDPRTFIDSQVWPYRVEFVDGGMETGVLNIHHGPGIHFAGVVGPRREGAYRDLHYFYGSYALTMRWIRPTRLQFWLEDAPGEGTSLRVQFDAHVVPWITKLWTRA